MQRDPAFLYYDADAARDTSHMSRLERGGYFDIIQAQRKFIGITLEQAKKVLGKDFDKCWPQIELILQKEGDVFFIEWVRNAIEKRAKNNEGQRLKMQNYWDKKKSLDSEPMEHSEDLDEM